MKYVGSKDKNIKYKPRPGAYAIIIGENEKKVGIVTDGDGFFYLGGGIEKGETELEALKRELIEESGYSIKNIKEFKTIMVISCNNYITFMYSSISRLRIA